MIKFIFTNSLERAKLLFMLFKIIKNYILYKLCIKRISKAKILFTSFQIASKGEKYYSHS